MAKKRSKSQLSFGSRPLCGDEPSFLRAKLRAGFAKTRLWRQSLSHRFCRTCQWMSLPQICLSRGKCPGSTKWHFAWALTISWSCQVTGFGEVATSRLNSQQHPDTSTLLHRPLTVKSWMFSSSANQSMMLKFICTVDIHIWATWWRSQRVENIWAAWGGDCE